MAGPAVGTSNVGMRAIGSAIGEATNVNETSNLSLASLLSGDSHNGIQNTFPSNDSSGPADTFNRIGGTNNPLQSTSLDNPGASIMNNLKSAPFHMSHTFGGQHADLSGGPGQLCIHHSISINAPSGNVVIHDLDIGDVIYSYDFKKDKKVEAEILDIWIVKHKDLVDVIYGDSVTDNIVLTKDHPIFLEDGSIASYSPEQTKEKYNLETKKLQVGDNIQLIDKIGTVQKFEYKEDMDTTYTILTKYNNFFAGNVLVHSERIIKE